MPRPSHDRHESLAMHAHDLDHAAPLPLPLAPYQALATVLSPADDGGWIVDDGRQHRAARRAASCLLAPAAGDRVWVVGEAAGSLYVLAVLERAAPHAPASLAFPGDVAVTAGGRLTLAAQAGLDLGTPGAVGVSAGELHVQAKKGQAAIEELSLFARTVFASLTKVTRVGQVLELLVDRVTQRSKLSVRAIEGLDQTRAETIDYRAEHTAHVRAEHAFVDGKELVKLDGGQIHLG
jgi:Protein of unknown function (DUF3540)